MRCETYIKATPITIEQIRERYFQKPQPGFYLTQLVVGRLVKEHGHLESAVKAKVAG